MFELLKEFEHNLTEDIQSSHHVLIHQILIFIWLWTNLHSLTDPLILWEIKGTRWKTQFHKVKESPVCQKYCKLTSTEENITSLVEVTEELMGNGKASQP